MTTAELKNAIKTADFNRCFIFCGEEEYLKRYYVKTIRQEILTDEGFSLFNHFVFEGEKIDFGKLFDAISSPPMISEFKLVEWHLANFDAMKESELETLAELCRSLSAHPYCCLLFWSGEGQLSVGTLPKRPSKLYTVLSEFCSVVVFERSTEAQLIGWIQRHIKHESLEADSDVCRMLLSQCGRDMDVLSSEIDKLCAYALSNGKSTVTGEDVLRVCSSVFESDAFGLTNALLAKDRAYAFDCLLDLKRKKTEPTIVLGSIFKLFSDILAVANLAEEGFSQKDISQKLKFHEYKVGLYIKYSRKSSIAELERILSECRRIDVSVKRSMLSPYTSIEKFICSVV